MPSMVPSSSMRQGTPSSEGIFIKEKENDKPNNDRRPFLVRNGKNSKDRLRLKDTGITQIRKPTATESVFSQHTSVSISEGCFLFRQLLSNNNAINNLYSAHIHFQKGKHLPLTQSLGLSFWSYRKLYVALQSVFKEKAHSSCNITNQQYRGKKNL